MKAPQLKQLSIPLITFSLYIGAYIALTWSFFYFMLVIYKYDWLELSIPKSHDVDFISIALVSSIALCFSFILSFNKSSPSNSFLSILYIVFILPIIILCGWNGLSYEYLFFVILSFSIVYGIVLLPGIKMPRIKEIEFLSTDLLIKLSVTVSAFVLFIAIANGGLRYFNIDLDRVYEFRRAANANIPLLGRYLLTNSISALLPFGAALSLWHNKKMWFSLILVLSFLFFALFANKAYLFSIPTSVLAYVLFRSKNVVRYILLGTICVSIFSSILVMYNPNLTRFGTYVTRRVFFVPAYLNYMYYDFFKSHEHILWSDSKVSMGLSDNPYGIPAPQVIANEYSGKDWSKTIVQYANANTGWLGSGYAHLGLIGMLLYSIFVGLLVKFVNFLALKTTRSVAAGACIVSYLSLFGSSDIPSMFFTHGILVLIICTFCLKSNEKRSSFISRSND